MFTVERRLLQLMGTEPDGKSLTCKGRDDDDDDDDDDKLKEKFGSCTRETFDSFTTKDSYTWNITHNTESTAV
jgi:hypothetical protein